MAPGQTPGTYVNLSNALNALDVLLASGLPDEDIHYTLVDMFVAGSAIFRDPRTEEAYKVTIDGMRKELAAAKVGEPVDA